MGKTDLVAHEQPVDLIRESSNRLVTVVFPQSPSKNFPIALSIAQQGIFRQAAIGGRRIHIASFDKDERGAKLAIALIECVGAWKSVVIYANGQLIKNWYELKDVLTCYLESCLCTDFRAHCFQVIDDPGFSEPSTLGLSISLRAGPTKTAKIAVDRYTFPCKKIYQSTDIDPDHPSSHQDQIQAAAVKRLCHLCPRFDPKNYKKIGTKTYEVEID